MADTAYQSPQAPYPPLPPYAPPVGVSNKSFTATWLLALFLGGIGVDRFYLGKVGTGMLKLITLGGFGVWALIDLILVLTGVTRDKQGRPLAGREQTKKVAWIVTGVLLALSIVLGAVDGANTSSQSVSQSFNEGANSAQNQSAAAPAKVAAPAKKAAAPAAPKKSTAPVNTAGTWAAKTYGTFAPITKSGTGDDVITLPAGIKAGLVTAKYTGTGNFSMSVLDASNQSTGELLVDTIGSYSGVTAWGFSTLGKDTTIQVSADAAWSVTLTPVSSAPKLTTSGAGDGVFLYSGGSGTLTATHAGTSNFTVEENTNAAFSDPLLIDTIGTYSGTVPLTAGPAVIVIGADGTWTMLTK